MMYNKLCYIMKIGIYEQIINQLLEEKAVGHFK